MVMGGARLATDSDDIVSIDDHAWRSVYAHAHALPKRIFTGTHMVTGIVIVLGTTR